jgi:hypothetical protein
MSAFSCRDCDKKKRNNLSQNSRCPGLDSNRAPSEFEFTALPLQESVQWKEVVVSCFKVLSRPLTAGTDRNYKIVSIDEFEVEIRTWTYRIRSRNVANLIAMVSQTCLFFGSETREPRNKKRKFKHEIS